MADKLSIRGQVFVNGKRVAEATEYGEWPGGVDTDGRALESSRFTVPVQFDVVIDVDSASAAFIHERRSYGTYGLESLIDALPKCQHRTEDGASFCDRPTLYPGGSCGRHNDYDNGQPELPYASVVRRIREVIDDTRAEIDRRVANVRPENE